MSIQELNGWGKRVLLGDAVCRVGRECGEGRRLEIGGVRKVGFALDRDRFCLPVNCASRTAAYGLRSPALGRYFGSGSSLRVLGVARRGGGDGRRKENGRKRKWSLEVGRCGVVGSRAGLPGRKWGGRGMGLLTDGRGRLGREGKTGKSASCWRRASRWWELWVVSWGWGQSVLYDSGTRDRADHGSYCESAGSGSTRKVYLSPRF